MKLIIENLHGQSNLEILTENTAAGGRVLYLEGPVFQCNRVNRNGRNYDYDSVGVPAVNRYLTEYVEDRRAIGEVEHPDYPFPKLSKAAIKMESMHWDQYNAIGKARVLNNPNGQIIASLAEADFNMATSTRGLGDVNEAMDQVLPGYMLTAVDVVDRPSGQVCYMKALRESVNWVQNDGGVWVAQDVSANIDNVIKENSLIESDFLQRFERALNKIS